MAAQRIMSLTLIQVIKTEIHQQRRFKKKTIFYPCRALSRCLTNINWILNESEDKINRKNIFRNHCPIHPIFNKTYISLTNRVTQEKILNEKLQPDRIWIHKTKMICAPNGKLE